MKGGSLKNLKNYSNQNLQTKFRQDFQIGGLRIEGRRFFKLQPQAKSIVARRISEILKAAASLAKFPKDSQSGMPRFDKLSKFLKLQPSRWRAAALSISGILWANLRQDPQTISKMQRCGNPRKFFWLQPQAKFST